MKCIVVVSRQRPSSVDGHGAFGLLHDAAVTKRDRHVGNRGDLGIVGDEDKRRASRAVDLQQQVDDVVSGRAVEIACRFVRQENRRVVGERSGDRDALLLAAGELRRVVMAAAREPDFTQKRRRARGGAWTAGDLDRDEDVFKRGQRRQQMEELKDKPDLRAAKPCECVLAEAGDVDPVDQNRSRGRCVQARRSARATSTCRCRTRQ